MKTGTRTATRSRAATEQTPSHRAGDILGIVLIAVALTIVISLAVGGTGVLGEALGGFFRGLFGRGAWVAPIAFTFVGVALLAGRRYFELTRLTWGLLLLFLAIVGGMAGHRNGDYFDLEVVARTGGYLGAIVGWLFDTLIGRAKGIGIGALGMVGLILCINAPLRQVAQGAAEKVRSKRQPAIVPAEKPRRAVIAVPEAPAAKRRPLPPADEPAPLPYNLLDEPEPEPEKKPEPKRQPIVHGAVPAAFQNRDAQAKEGYTLPPLSLLAEPKPRPVRTAAEMQKNIEILEGTLAQFNIDADVVEIAHGPTITRYEIQLGPGIRVSRIVALADNLAMNLAAHAVRVEAPIPGKAAIGVEVPNENRSTVTLRELLADDYAVEYPGRLLVGLGQDVSGQNKYTDLTKMPHLLIGGATNSGKSIGLATIITSLLMRNTPKEVRMVMIDPKRVELSLFDGVPHLMCPVVKDVKEAPGVLRAVWREMDMRYDKFSEAGVRNIDGWNEKATFQDRLPYIVVVIDELADLMIQAAAEVETSICRLAQLARAVGIHLVIATQRPSVDVITGTIKANIASRIAFSVTSQIDSRTILDQKGAENLVGKGDMLFMPIDAAKPTRIQGCYVSEREIETICEHWKAQERPQYVLNPVQIAIQEREAEIAEQQSDPLWEDVVRWVVERGEASTSMIQRRFSIGFQRASRLLDMMEERGIVGAREGTRPREVLISIYEVDNVLGKPSAFAPPPIDTDPLDE